MKMSKSKSESVLNITLDIIQRSVAADQEVRLMGFGVFQKAFRKGRKGQNPKTGEKVDIPPTCVPKFKPGKEFKKSLEVEKI